MIIKRYKFRLYPTNKQSVYINRNIGACRFIYNLALETKNFAYSSYKKNISRFELVKQIGELKKECIWLKDMDSQALQQTMKDLETGFNRFYKKVSNYPKFRKKKGTESYRNPHGHKIKIIKNKIYFPKFTEGVKFVQDRTFRGTIKSYSIIRTNTNKYFISILVEETKEIPIKISIKEKTAIGIDLGIKSFIVTSNGLKIDNPKYLKNKIERLKVLQRRLRNKKNGSNNKHKAYKKIALVHEKITNQRRDFLNKLSTQLIKNHDTLCLESLDVESMAKNHNLAQNINDAGWGTFLMMCKYKSEWYGRNILQIPKFEPSTKLCYKCGVINNNLTLLDREWTCQCGTHHDRDINAAINIKNYCIRNSGKAIPGVPVEVLTVVKPKKQEVNNMVGDYLNL